MTRRVVLFGGRSSERLVSVASAQNVCTTLPDAEPWFIAADGAVGPVDRAALLQHQRPFEVPFAPPAPLRFGSVTAALAEQAWAGATLFLALHGGEGEDGSLQAALERARVPFTGSGSAASAAAFDKAKAKVLVGARGARLARAHLLAPADEATLRARLDALFAEGPRWVLKPVADGSSFGLVHLKQASQVPEAAATLARVGVTYLAEAFVAGRELTVGVVDFEGGTRALPVSEVRLPPEGAFDYTGKYLSRTTEELTPAPLTDAEREAAQALAVTAHQALGCVGYSRTDMMLTPEGPVFLETNTLPGLTKASFIPQQLAAEGTPFAVFLERQLALATRAR